MAFREQLSSILLTCAGDTVQYEETLNVLCDSVESYILQLTAATLKVAPTPTKIMFRDVVHALSCDPIIQTGVKARATARDEFKAFAMS